MLAIVACGASEDDSSDKRNNKAGSGGTAGSNNQNKGGSAGSGKGGSTSNTGGTSSGTGGSGGTGGTNNSSGGTAGEANGGSNNATGGSAGAPSVECEPGGTGFDTSIEGVAIDKETCLMWERLDPTRTPKRNPPDCIAPDNPSKLCWPDANDYCAGLSLGGLGDWRLPTRDELKTLMVQNASPSIDKSIFEQAQANYYWTSEEDSANGHYCLDFSNNATQGHAGNDGPQNLRCVRGAQ